MSLLDTLRWPALHAVFLAGVSAVLIVADENIPLLDEFFGDLGDIRRCSGRSMTAADVAGADILMVRSVTRVDSGLLGGHRPRFVGSATIGTDHIDLDWLAANGIPFSAAPGCNARAVAEYVATALCLYSRERERALPGMTLGVVGCGNVGRQVAALGRVLGMRVYASDPFLAPEGFPSGVTPAPLADVLACSDVLSLHVPLTTGGVAPTRHLLDARLLGRGRWGLLLNTSRGAVVDNRALATLLSEDPERQVVLDVWEEEPRVPAELLRRVWLGTPHVAGYSAEGKWRGTAMIHEAACSVLGTPSRRSLAEVLRQRGDAVIELPWPGSLSALMAGLCPLPADTGRLRAGLATGADGVSPLQFDALRRDYPERREFAHYRIKGAAGLPAEPRMPETTTPQEAAALLVGLGFGLAD